MSYIEDIQKINKLAKEMLSHGMATSLDEAVSKAQETLRKSGAITLDLRDMAQQLDEQNQRRKEMFGEERTDPKTGQVTVEKPENVVEKNEQVQEPIVEPVKQQERVTWQEAMSKNTKYVVEQFKGYQQMFEQMGNEIVELKREIQALKRNQSQFQVSSQREQVINIDDDAPVQQTQQTVEPVKQESHPKQGNFSSEDVSIEKVFYFGNK